MLKLDNKKCVAGTLDDIHIGQNQCWRSTFYLLENIDHELSSFAYLEARRRSILQ
jgi:hypothetical protein